MTDTATDPTLNGSAEPVPAHVLKKGYLPPSTRIKPGTGYSPMINRFPLGDLENFSVSRAALARGQELLGKSHDTAWRYDAPWERAYYDALRDIEYKAQGEYVSGLDGGFLAPEIWSGPYFGLLRSFSVLDQLPVTKIRVPARVVHIPKVMGDVTMTYPQENATGTSTGFTFGQVSYTARKAEHFMPLSNEMIRDAAEVADQVLRLESARAHALDRDTQAILGKGGMNPTGLLTLAGDLSVTTGTIAKYYAKGTATTSIDTTPAHGTPSFLHVSQLRGKVHALNGVTQVPTGQAHCNGMIVHSRFEQTVLTQTAAAGPWTDGQGRPLWMSGLATPADLINGGGDLTTGPGTTSGNDLSRAPSGEALMGQAWAMTNIMPTTSTDGGGTTSSFIIAGWWQMYVLFECNAFIYDTTVEASGFQSDQTLVRVIHRYDCSPARPEAFAVLAGCDA